jgi:hypothetical protein
MVPDPYPTLLPPKSPRLPPSSFNLEVGSLDLRRDVRVLYRWFHTRKGRSKGMGMSRMKPRRRRDGI